MEAYYGTPGQVALQKKADTLSEWSQSTPGAFLAGRLVGADDPERLGWDTIFGHLEEDGFFGLRLIPAGGLPAIRARLAERGYRFDTWDVFSADAETIRHALSQMDTGLPDGFTVAEAGRLTDVGFIKRVQAFMGDNGVVPFSGAMLSGEVCPSALTVIETADGAVAATAFGYFPHNRHSPHAGTMWGGLVAVDPRWRGRRLGVLANAAMLRACIDACGARAVYELASATNEASRRMIRRCGLAHDPGVVSGVATRGDARFTR